MPAPAALITGGTTGIGRATADLLHERGYRVMVTGQNPATLAEARDHFPGDVAVIRADARSLPDTDRVAAEAKERFGSLDVLFLNAGISRPAPLDKVDEAFFDEVFATNAKGQFFTLQKTLPLLADHASVIVTIGVGVTLGIPGGSVTAGSRGALLSMVPSLALELAPRRIRVNAVSPGATDTPIWAKSGMPAEMLATVTASMAERIPFGRLGLASEVAETVAFLASPAAAYITGQHLAVAGGSGLGA
ncbi:SDR family oxidoreductase [Paractinoplanes lichenicola]|uniref:SDR family oxidoreductase n=1 Tax=Paractinoplanes lichenicola TaxID=2802976 RepID=A0ABS1W4M4_9ACTN|nr:SDR family oxidoreductase [Actinoplanes lichenicola]MBL7261669.1 SDR family oxidoreductase [Actinoplanes lichenicola]